MKTYLIKKVKVKIVIVILVIICSIINFLKIKGDSKIIPKVSPKFVQIQYNPKER